MTINRQTKTPQDIVIYPALICASPRKNGNSASITKALANHFETFGQKTNIFYLHEYPTGPCTGCGHCEKTAQTVYTYTAHSTHNSQGAHATSTVKNFETFGCPFSLQDAMPTLIHTLLYAPFVCFVAPIYMYHLPAQAKALLDRLQPFWHLHTTNNTFIKQIPPRPCYTTLIAGRKQGEHLFSGVTRSLRFAMRPLHLTVHDCLELYGLDRPTDFTASLTTQGLVQSFATKIMKQHKQNA